MDTFNPVKYSKEENAFLLENVGKPPIVALNGLNKVGVNPRAVRPVLQEVYDREQLRTHEGVVWAGIDALKEKIKDYLTIDAQWESAHQKSRGRVPRYPTLYTRDGKGRFHWGGPGSDSDYPKHYEKDGAICAFELDLGGDVVEEWDFEAGIVQPKMVLIHDEAKSRIECPICNHTESYKKESRSSFNAARARMSKHLKSATEEQSLHWELHTMEFGS